MIRLIRIVLLPALMVCLLGLPNSGRAAEAFSPAQRAEIVSILRDALTADPSILRDAMAALQTAEQRQQEADAAARVAANSAKMIDPSDPVAGNSQGDVTIVEFFDVRCPYCKRMEQPMAELLKRDRGVRLVYKDLPVLGPASVLGAKALLAAQKQGHYEVFRDAMMHTTAPITEETIRAEAQRLGLDAARLAQDMNDPAIAARLKGNQQLAAALAIQGTPALVIGGRLLPGAVDLAELQQSVDSARLALK